MRVSFADGAVTAEMLGIGTEVGGTLRQPANGRRTVARTSILPTRGAGRGNVAGYLTVIGIPIFHVPLIDPASLQRFPRQGPR